MRLETSWPVSSNWRRRSCVTGTSYCSPPPPHRSTTRRANANGTVSFTLTHDRASIPLAWRPSARNTINAASAVASSRRSATMKPPRPRGRGLRGRVRRFELHGIDGVGVFDDYARPPHQGRRRARGGTYGGGTGASSRCTSRTSGAPSTCSGSSPRCSSHPIAAIMFDVYGARRRPDPCDGRTGLRRLRPMPLTSLRVGLAVRDYAGVALTATMSSRSAAATSTQDRPQVLGALGRAAPVAGLPHLVVPEELGMRRPTPLPVPMPPGAMWARSRWSERIGSVRVRARRSPRTGGHRSPTDLYDGDCRGRPPMGWFAPIGARARPHGAYKPIVVVGLGGGAGPTDRGDRGFDVLAATGSDAVPFDPRGLRALPGSTALRTARARSMRLGRLAPPAGAGRRRCAPRCAGHESLTPPARRLIGPVTASVLLLVLGSLGAAYSPFRGSRRSGPRGAARRGAVEAALADEVGAPLPFVDASALRHAAQRSRLIETCTLEEPAPARPRRAVVERRADRSGGSGAGSPWWMLRRRPLDDGCAPAAGR